MMIAGGRRPDQPSPPPDGPEVGKGMERLALLAVILIVAALVAVFSHFILIV